MARLSLQIPQIYSSLIFIKKLFWYGGSLVRASKSPFTFCGKRAFSSYLCLKKFLSFIIRSIIWLACVIKNPVIVKIKIYSGKEIIKKLPFPGNFLPTGSRLTGLCKNSGLNKTG